MLKRVDHLVYATPDLNASITDLQNRLGVRAVQGGQHPGRGTRNALLALGERCYLEIVGPDPSHPWDDGLRWFNVDVLHAQRLVTWAANTTNLEQEIVNAARNGLRLGPITAGSRMRSDGVTLHWKFTNPDTVVADGVVPFLIDWGSSPHPASTSPGPLQLTSLRAEHPEPEKVILALSALGIDLLVDYGATPALIAEIKTREGIVELR